METATVVPTPAKWLPEDDILLKSAIEEGASLEALAKGAVPFSCNFTLQEVQDRWHALLYDPEISAKACAHLSLDDSEKIKEIKEKHRKRKVGTLRKRYHKRVKKFRNEFFSSTDLGFLNEPNLHSYTANGSNFHEHGSQQITECIPDAFGLQATNLTNFNILHQDFPRVLTDLGKSLENNNNNNVGKREKNDSISGFPVAECPFPAQGSLRIDGMPPFETNSNEFYNIRNIQKILRGNSLETGKCLLPGGEISNSNVYTMGFSPSLSSMPPWKTMEDDKKQICQDLVEIPCNGDSKRKMADKLNGDSFINPASISDDFVDLPDSLFDFSNELLFMDMDGKDLINKSCCDNTFSNAPMDIDAFRIGENIANSVIATEPASNSHTVLGEDRNVSHLNVQPPSSPLLYCALNTEDPDIPCNDDIFLLIHPGAPNATSSSVTPIPNNATDPLSAKEKINLPAINPIKRREELAQSYKASSMFGSYFLPEMGKVQISNGPTARAEPKDTSKDLALRHKAVPDPIKCKLPQKSLASAVKENLDKDLKKVVSGALETPAKLKGFPRPIEASSVGVNLPEPVVNPSKSDPEGAESENEDPHFSDIEAMILDMDLGSYDDNLHYTRKVANYQQDRSKRTIVRLEQCARASIQRAMTSQCALAVLYGRHSRHFIRKKEVILGRSTEETAVDIDLGKEGRHNKISRRQAIVKMEDDGTFSLKNLAKNPILVNGAEVGTGELVTLSSSCLIEIRGRICYVFESNQKYVKRYLQSINRKNQGQMASFKCVTKQEAI